MDGWDAICMGRWDASCILVGCIHGWDALCMDGWGHALVGRIVHAWGALGMDRWDASCIDGMHHGLVGRIMH